MYYQCSGIVNDAGDVVLGVTDVVVSVAARRHADQLPGGIVGKVCDRAAGLILVENHICPSDGDGCGVTVLAVRRDLISCLSIVPASMPAALCIACTFSAPLLSKASE